MVTKIAYADWTRAGEYSRTLTQHAIRLVQRNLTPGGDKNGADINLALDALEMAFTHPHINAYVIVGGDSDFLSLVEKLKQYDKKVFVVGGRAFTSMILQRNCHEFIAYENLAGVPQGRPPSSGRPMPAAAASAPIAQAFPIVRRALKILADREVSPQTGLLKSTLLQLDSTFSERNYGASSFLDFVEKLAQVRLRAAEALGPQRDGRAERGLRRRAARRRRKATTPARRRLRATRRRLCRRRLRVARTWSPPAVARLRRSGGAPSLRRQAAASTPASQEPAGPPLGDQADGVRRRRTDPRRRHQRALADVPAQRQADSAADRGRLRRAALRLRRADGSAEGLPARGLRAGRARSPRRPARVPGPGAPGRSGAGAASAGRTCRSPTSKSTRTSRSRRRQRRPDRRGRAGRRTSTTSEPIPIDTTAELLGRAKPRKPRARARASGAGGGAEEGRGEEAGGHEAGARQEVAASQRRRRQPLTRSEETAEIAKLAEKTILGDLCGLGGFFCPSTSRYRGNPPTA